MRREVYRCYSDAEPLNAVFYARQSPLRGSGREARVVLFVREDGEGARNRFAWGTSTRRGTADGELRVLAESNRYWNPPCTGAVDSTQS